MSDYTNLDRPYDSVMNRIPGGTSPVVTQNNSIFNQAADTSGIVSDYATSNPAASQASGPTTSFTGVETPTGSVATNPVNSPQSLSDVYINTFIRSIGWKPNARGFNIDGVTGSAEFADLDATSITLTESNFGGVAQLYGDLWKMYPTTNTIFANGAQPTVEMYAGSPDLTTDPYLSPGLYLKDINTGQTAFYTASGYSAPNAHFDSLSVDDLSVNFEASFVIMTTELVESDLIPNVGSSWNLGTTGNRWSHIYLVNNPDVSSDARLKENIIPIQYGLSSIQALNPVYFTRKSDRSKNLGFIAQEVMKHVPEVVSGTDESGYGMSYEQLIPILVKAVQELSAEVEKLKKGVT